MMFIRSHKIWISLRIIILLCLSWHSFPLVWAKLNAIHGGIKARRRWKMKHVDEWTSSDVKEWIVEQLFYFGVCKPSDVNLKTLMQTTGKDIKTFTPEMFENFMPGFGTNMYHRLQRQMSLDSVNFLPSTLETVSHCQSALSVPSQEEPLDLNMKSSPPLLTNRQSSVSAEWKPTLINVRGWEIKPVDLWNPEDVVEWIIRQMLILKVENPAAFNLEAFAETTGKDIQVLPLQKFEMLLPGFGKDLYQQLQTKIKSRSRDFPQPPVKRTSPSAFSSPSEEKSHQKIKKGSSSCTRSKPSGEKVGRVWEFIRDLLLNPSYQQVISWEDPARGTFRFEDSALAAKLWGQKRGNNRMNFKNFSRAMRYNYKMGYLKPVKKNRLVYQFGEKATGWKTEQTEDYHECKLCNQPYADTFVCSPLLCQDNSLCSSV